MFDFRNVLSLSPIYILFRRLVGGGGGTKRIIEEFVRPQAGERLLDIGCGPGNLLEYLHDLDVEYVGFDLSRKYIDSARKRFGRRGRFICERVSETSLSGLGKFDVVTAIGLLHHLDDEEALQLFRLAHTALKEGGRFVTFDGCFTKSQSRLARQFLHWDRGKHVRTCNQYVHLVEKVFGSVSVEIRHDLINIPYTHLIMQCNSRASSAPQGKPANRVA